MLAHFDQGRRRVFATKICLVALSTRAILVDWGNWGKAAVARSVFENAFISSQGQRQVRMLHVAAQHAHTASSLPQRGR
jgi:hypothetical protein